MSTHLRSSIATASRKPLIGLAMAMLLAGASFLGAQRPGARGPWSDPSKAVVVKVSPDVPLSILSKDTGETKTQVLGGALVVIDLRCNLTLRNEGSQYLRGVTFGILADRLASGGRASVSLPSLHVEPDGEFPVRLHLQLLRPLPAAPTDVVEVEVDGVLLSDFSFFGPDRLHSRRRLTVWEMEADRDRRYFKSILETEGPEQLRVALQASLDRQSQRLRLEVRPVGDDTESRAEGSARRLLLASVNIPDSPLQMVSGTALVQGAGSSAPLITVTNRSPKPVRYFELGWLVTDAMGRHYLAGAVPSADSGIELAPGASSSTQQQREFLFRTRPEAEEQAFAINGMSGYVSQVQFKDGTYWIPSRQSLETSKLIDTTPVSAEEQRLTGLYQSKGLDGVIAELAKF